jgi:hypothetical protein
MERTLFRSSILLSTSGSARPFCSEGPPSGRCFAGSILLPTSGLAFSTWRHPTPPAGAGGSSAGGWPPEADAPTSL